MNVCLINHLYSAYKGGGAEAVVRAEAKVRQAAGDRVFVITTKAWGDRSIPKKEVVGGITIYRLSGIPGLFYGFLGTYGRLRRRLFFVTRFFPIVSFFRIWRIIQQESITEVRTHNVAGIAFTLGRFLNMLGVRYIHRLHDIQLVTPSGIRDVRRNEDTRFEQFYARVMQWCYGRPTEVISPSQFLLDWYKKRNFFKKSIVRVEGNPPIMAVPSRNKRVSGRVLFVGSLETHKGIDVLMRAWNTMPTNEGFTLHIAGSGSREKDLKTWAATKRNVSLLGFISGSTLEREFHEASALVFTSLAIENSPTVIREALAYGVPVVAVDTGGVRELLDKNSLSRLVPPNDAHATLRALRQLLRSS